MLVRTLLFFFRGFKYILLDFMIEYLPMELKTIKGVGEKTEKALNRAGVYKAEDLIAFPTEGS